MDPVTETDRERILKFIEGLDAWVQTVCETGRFDRKSLDTVFEQYGEGFEQPDWALPAKQVLLDLMDIREDAGIITDPVIAKRLADHKDDDSMEDNLDEVAAELGFKIDENGVVTDARD